MSRIKIGVAVTLIVFSGGFFTAQGVARPRPATTATEGHAGDQSAIDNPASKVLCGDGTLRNCFLPRPKPETEQAGTLGIDVAPGSNSSVNDGIGGGKPSTNTPPPNHRVNDPETIWPQARLYAERLWPFAAGVLLAALIGYLIMHRYNLSRRRLEQSEPSESHGVPTTASLSQEVAELGNWVQSLDREVRELKALLAVAKRNSSPLTNNGNGHLGFANRLAEAWQPQPASLPSPPAASMPGPDVVAALLREYMALVAQRAANSEEFVRQYSARPVERIASVGQFALGANEANPDVWALPANGTQYWFLLPGRETIRRWSYLSAMGGSGAAERLNGSYGMSKSGDPALRIIKPAVATSTDGRSFQVVMPGELSGIA